MADFYGEDLLMEDKIRQIEEVMQGIDKVTSTDILELSKRLFVEKGRNLAVIGPKAVVTNLIC